MQTESWFDLLLQGALGIVWTTARAAQATPPMADVLTLDDGPPPHEDDLGAPAEPIRVLVRVRPTADGSAGVLQVDEARGAVRLTRGR